MIFSRGIQMNGLEEETECTDTADANRIDIQERVTLN